MSRFFVGQRVRVVHQGRFNGRETVVLQVDTPRYVLGGVRVDIPHPLWGRCIFEEHELVPLVPEGHQPVAISEVIKQSPELARALGVVA